MRKAALGFETMNIAWFKRHHSETAWLKPQLPGAALRYHLYARAAFNVLAVGE